MRNFCNIYINSKIAHRSPITHENLVGNVFYLPVFVDIICKRERFLVSYSKGVSKNMRVNSVFPCWLRCYIEVLLLGVQFPQTAGVNSYTHSVPSMRDRHYILLLVVSKILSLHSLPQMSSNRLQGCFTSSTSNLSLTNLTPLKEVNLYV